MMADIELSFGVHWHIYYRVSTKIQQVCFLESHNLESKGACDHVLFSAVYWQLVDCANILFIRGLQEEFMAMKVDRVETRG